MCVCVCVCVCVCPLCFHVGNCNVALLSSGVFLPVNHRGSRIQFIQSGSLLKLVQVRISKVEHQHNGFRAHYILYTLLFTLVLEMWMEVEVEGDRVDVGGTMWKEIGRVEGG